MLNAMLHDALNLIYKKHNKHKHKQIKSDDNTPTNPTQTPNVCNIQNIKHKNNYIIINRNITTLNRLQVLTEETGSGQFVPVI